MKNKIITKIVLNLFCVSIIFCSLSCESLRSQFEPISDENIEATRNNCRNLILPNAFVNKISDKEFARMTAAVFSTQYRSNIDPKIVEDHFYKQLIPQGWKYTQRLEIGESTWYFDKGKFSIVIHYGDIAFSSDKLYSVACTWGSNSH